MLNRNEMKTICWEKCEYLLFLWTVCNTLIRSHDNSVIIIGLDLKNTQKKNRSHGSPKCLGASLHSKHMKS